VCHLFGQGLGEHSQGFLLTCDRCKMARISQNGSIPISFFVPTQAGRDFKLVSYRMAQEQLEDCGVPGCRHHDANVRLFPAYFRTKQDLHGIPLLYVAGKTQAIAVVLKPAKWDPQFEHDAAVRRFSGPFEVQVVALSRIRDYCLAVVHSSDVYVFRAGSRVFNHLV
jgi:hypothetical protein